MRVYNRDYAYCIHAMHTQQYQQNGYKCILTFILIASLLISYVWPNCHSGISDSLIDAFSTQNHCCTRVRKNYIRNSRTKKRWKCSN